MIDWQGASNWIADDLLGGGSRRHSLRGRACEVVAELLKNGPRPFREIERAARQRGISTRTLRRARRDLSIDSQVVGNFRNHENWWLLPGQEIPDGVMSPEEKKWREALRKLEGTGREGESRVA